MGFSLCRWKTPEPFRVALSHWSMSVRVVQTATTTPPTPPSSASNRLSLISWLTRRDRPPPSAARTAISRDRTRPHANSRPATLAQAISNTSPASPIITFQTTGIRLDADGSGYSTSARVGCGAQPRLISRPAQIRTGSSTFRGCRTSPGAGAGRSTAPPRTASGRSNKSPERP